MSLQEAVFILHQHDVVASYWLADFEQRVRRQSSLASIASDKLLAAYVQIGNHRCAEAIVLFEIPLQRDSSEVGVPVSDWYMPLRRLADSAGRGPNMGAGRIKLACQTQCSISWHADSLWEPVTSDFMAIRKALRDNRLAAGATTAQSAEKTVDPVSAVERVSGTSASSLLAQKHTDPEVEELKRTLRNEVEAYRNQLAQLQHEIERQRGMNEKLNRQTQASMAHGHHDDVEQLRQLHCQQVADLEQQIEQLKSELELALHNSTTDTGVDACSAPAAESGADNDQMLRLQQQVENLEEQSIDRFVSRIGGLDAVLVAFHPGAGHLTITPDNMKLYADNPIAYAAQKCFVGEEEYRNWLDHYDDPRCQQCQAEIPRVEQPRDFEYRLSAFCKLHKRANLVG
ncbi:MAG: hypothetical protein MK185_01365 [Saccharospirillaceae bacterium]|nr:hypothetical protein A3759_00315 [Thalassolituus sp. HI0120]MCH2039270.1 hypothetical protein [Saccharospirillaceae bacterium]